jgi:HAMP domain-containing protein
MKLHTKFTFSLLIATLIVFCFSLFLSFRHVETIAKNNAYKTCNMILAQVEASRNYVRDHLRPVMFKHVEKGEFVPEGMSASFVARSQFELFLKEYPDYYVKFASNNPRNPINQANDKEKEILAQFDENPELNGWQGIVSRENKRYFMVAKPFRFKTKCMRCHSDPALSPVSMVARYGDQGGFMAKIGDVSMYSIGVPIEVTYADISHHTLIFFVPVFSLICLTLIISFFLYRQLVTNPIIDLQEGVRRLSQGDYQSQVDTEKAGELHELAETFNTMAEQLSDNISRREKVEHDLRKAHDELEVRVEKRTAELMKTNEELHQQIEKRKHAESEVATLSGFLPICASCKKIRDDKGYWNQVENYIEAHSTAQFSHSMCIQCSDKLYGGQDWYEKAKKEGKIRE